MATVFALTLTGTVRAQETKLTVMVFQGMQNLPLFAAQSNGLFAKRGLAIDIQIAPSSEEMRAGLADRRCPNGDAPIEAKRSVTHIRPIAGLVGATLVECRLETGRQHQIRIHISELGHPLVGERVYIRDYAGLKIEAIRPMLHARTLGFVHPRTAERILFEREPPDDFQATIESLRPTSR